MNRRPTNAHAIGLLAVADQLTSQVDRQQAMEMLEQLIIGAEQRLEELRVEDEDERDE